MDRDVFISYSHKSDIAVAEALEDGLRGVARTWWTFRPGAKVFRDTTSLAASSDLGGAIKEALASSRYFIYLASPAAAQSKWVREEISYWREHHSMDTFLIGLSDGSIEWDRDRGDFDWERTTALPRELSGVFRAEPLWVDLRKNRQAATFSMAPGSTFRDAVVTLAAPLHGVSKDELDSKDLQLQRRAARVRRAMVSGLCVLLAIALTAGVIAWLNANEAVRQRNLAQERATIATARLLAATAVNDSPDDSARAQLLAGEAYRLRDDPQTIAALFQTVNDNPNLVRQHTLAAPVSALAAAAGGMALAGTADGQLIRWDPATDSSTVVRLGDQPVTAVAISDDGAVAAATDGRHAVLWHPGSAPVPLQIEQPGRVAVSTQGTTAAVLTSPDAIKDTGGVQHLATFDPSTGAQRRSVDLANLYWDGVGIPDEQTVAVTNGSGLWQRLRLSDLAVTVRQEQAQVNIGISAISDDGSSVASLGGGWAFVFGTASNQAVARYSTVSGPYTPTVFAIRRDGNEIASGGGGQLWVADVTAGQTDNRNYTELLGAGGADRVVFIGNSGRLITGKGTTLSVWDPAQRPRLRLNTDGLQVPDTSRSSRPTQMAVSPDGQRALLVGGFGDVKLHDLNGGPGPGTAITSPQKDVFPAWLSDGTPALIGKVGCGLYAVRGTGTQMLLEGQGVANVAARLTPDGRDLICVSEYGGMTVRRVSDGMYVYDSPGPNKKLTEDSDTVGVAAISEDGRYAAWIAGQDDGGGRLTVADSQERKTVTVSGASHTVGFAGDRLVVTHPDSSLDVRDPSGALIRTVHASSELARPMSWVPGTPFIGQIRNDGTVAVIDVDTGTILGTLRLPAASTWASARWEATAIVGVRSTGELLTATPAGSVVRWAASERSWLDLACHFAGRDLRPEEWREVTGFNPPGNLSCHR
ncbi:toll/interleukin-1 receptor domain-containing protein [Kitasatospora sp. NPDC101155]|uniref:toll/interleukin-1 receptor domain-containing protein n=1 Tax=Kitasatospora sp. NPDC101155 TaxID=3364097 RepID=UPI0038117B64